MTYRWCGVSQKVSHCLFFVSGNFQMKNFHIVWCCKKYLVVTDLLVIGVMWLLDGVMCLRKCLDVRDLLVFSVMWLPNGVVRWRNCHRLQSPNSNNSSHAHPFDFFWRFFIACNYTNSRPGWGNTLDLTWLPCFFCCSRHPHWRQVPAPLQINLNAPCLSAFWGVGFFFVMLKFEFFFWIPEP